MSQRYTLTQCYNLLQVDRKTFGRWLERAGLVPAVSKADERVRYLTREQIEQLAVLHERTLPVEASRTNSSEEDQSDQGEALRKLQAQLDQLERGQAREIAALTANIERLSDQLERLQEQLDEERHECEALRREMAARASQTPILSFKAWLNNSYPQPTQPLTKQQLQNRSKMNPTSDLADRLRADERLPDTATLDEYLNLLDLYRYSNDDRWRLENQLWPAFQRR